MLPETFRNRTACCFTGHRPQNLPGGGDPLCPGMESLRLRLAGCVSAAIACGVRRFLAGGADGFDTMAAEAVIDSLAAHPDVRLVLALPSKTQSNAYDEAMRARYARILDHAAEAYYASERSNGALSMLTRNRYLVDHADCCIAYLKHPSGGTLYTVNYALDRGLPVYNLAEADV